MPETLLDPIATTPSGEPRIPADLAGLTPEFFTRAISRMHPGTTVTAVELLESHAEGQMVSTSGRLKLALTYGPGSPPLPTRVISKTFVGERRALPNSMFETEIRIHQELLAGLDVEKAQCLAALFEPDTGNFMLLLEDLTLRGATFTDVTKPPRTPAQVGGLLDTLAAVHAAYWKSPKLDAPWLGQLTKGPRFDAWNNDFIVPVYKSRMAESPYRRDVFTRTGFTSAEQLWDRIVAVHRHHETTLPLTLCHGDTGAHNSYILPDDTGGFFDWQLSAKSAWVHDVHYVICTSLSVADRRAHERELVARYLARLNALGVDYNPKLDDAMDEYSLAILWGFGLGWFPVRAASYGMEIISANTERLFAACADHDVFRRAEKLP